MDGPFDDDEVLVAAGGHFVELLVVRRPGSPPIAATSSGTPIWPTAQGVEALLEHQSMPVIELVDRMAFAVRNDRSVKSPAPSSWAFCSGPGTVGNARS